MQFKKLITLILIFTFLLLAAAIAAPPVPKKPFLPVYWLTGQLTAPQEVSVANRTVRFSKADTAGKVEATTDGTGKFSLNVFELYYYFGIDINFTDNYQIEVYQANGWGKDAFVVELEAAQGFKDVGNIELAAGEGPTEDPVVPKGTIDFSSVERVGSDIKLSWAEDAVPDIYVLFGDYENEPVDGWVLVVENGVLKDKYKDNFELSGDGKSLIHKGQLANADADPKVFYRALEAGVDKAGKLSSAPAAGKWNITLYKTTVSGWNFISSPLFADTLDEILGTGFTAGDQLWIWDDQDQKFKAPITFSSGTWGDAYNLVRAKGVLFNLAGDLPKLVTLLGKVDITSLTIPIYVKAGTPSFGWNLIANPYPTAGFAGDADQVKGDSIWEWNSQQQKFIAPKTYNGSAWPDETNLEPGRAYGYNCVGDKGFNWEVN